MTPRERAFDVIRRLKEVYSHCNVQGEIERAIAEAVAEERAKIAEMARNVHFAHLADGCDCTAAGDIADELESHNA